MAGDKRQVNVLVHAKVHEAFARFHRASGGNRQDHVAAALVAYMGLSAVEREALFQAYKAWIGEAPPDMAEFREMMGRGREGRADAGAERAPSKTRGASTDAQAKTAGMRTKRPA